MLRLTDPVVVGRAADRALLVERRQAKAANPPAQCWTPGNGYTSLKPLQVWLKFIPFTAVEPETWQEPGSK